MIQNICLTYRSLITPLFPQNYIPGSYRLLGYFSFLNTSRNSNCLFYIVSSIILIVCSLSLLFFVLFCQILNLSQSLSLLPTFSLSLFSLFQLTGIFPPYWETFLLHIIKYPFNDVPLLVFPANLSDQSTLVNSFLIDPHLLAIQFKLNICTLEIRIFFKCCFPLSKNTKCYRTMITASKETFHIY